VLASASPARLATLRAAGFAPEVVVSGVDEEAVPPAPPAELCLTLARLKAVAAAGRLGDRPAPAGRAAPAGGAGAAGGAAQAGALVLGCDSLLELDGQAHGKPRDAEEARARWRRMRGGTGVLHTGHHLLRTGTGEHAEEVASTTVRFADLTDAEVDAYVATGEPLAVAGAFTVDGLGGPFVTGVDGDHHNVVGVSLPLLRLLLARLGTPVTDLWRR